MGCSDSHFDEYEEGPVHPDRLVMELNGGTVVPEDYLAKASLTLEEIEVMETGIYESSDSIELEEAYKLVETGYMTLENGYCKRKDGVWFIACLTPFVDVTGEMFDFWMRNCDTHEKFRWWHPNHNLTCHWDDQFFAVQPPDRGEGYYIGHVQSVMSKIDGVEYKLDYEYLKPSKFFDLNKLENSGVSACICARIHNETKLFGSVSIGYVVHVFRKIGGRNELRSRYWIGDTYKTELHENLLTAKAINTVANTSVFRAINSPESFVKGLWLNCQQSMQCLNSFLPHYFTSFVVKYNIDSYKMQQIAAAARAKKKKTSGMGSKSGNSGNESDSSDDESDWAFFDKIRK